MKKIIIAALFIVSNLLANNITAQERVKMNITSQPDWGPTGYDYVDYYYLPEIESYYNVPKHQYVYSNNGKWMFSNNLPPAYKAYNVYNGPKVVINEPTPYLNFNDHKAKYKNWNEKPVIIRDSRDAKYRNHWNNGKHKGWYKGKGNPHGNGNNAKNDDDGDDKKIKYKVKKDNDNDNGNGNNDKKEKYKERKDNDDDKKEKYKTKKDDDGNIKIKNKGKGNKKKDD